MIESVGPYAIIRPLRESSRGFSVYLARRVFPDDVGGPVEIAVVDKEAPGAASTRTAWDDEALVRASLVSPAVVQTLHVGETDRFLFEVSERSGGISLAETLARFRAASTHPPFGFAAGVALLVGEALRAVHALKGALGFLALEDVHVTFDGRVRFSRVTLGGDLELAPELSRRAADARSDAWVLGRTLRILLAGSPAPSDKPRVPSAFADAVRGLLLGSLATQRRQRMKLDDALAALQGIVSGLDGRDVASLVASALSPLQEQVEDDAPPMDVVARIREAPPATLSERGSLTKAGGPRTVVENAARTAVSRRGSGHDVERTSSSGERAEPVAVDVVEATPSAEAWAIPDGVFAPAGAPRTSVRTSVDMATDVGVSPLAGPATVEGTSSSESGHGDAENPNDTLAGLMSPDLDLHVDDDLSSTFSSSKPTPPAPGPDTSASTAHAAVEAPEPTRSEASVPSASDAAVWASGDPPEDEETHDDRRGRRPAPAPTNVTSADAAGEGADATAILERPSSTGGVFTRGADDDDDDDGGAADEPADRTIILDASVEEKASRGRGGRRRAPANAPLPSKPSIIVAEYAPDADPDSTLMLDSGPVVAAVAPADDEGGFDEQTVVHEGEGEAPSDGASPWAAVSETDPGEVPSSADGSPFARSVEETAKGDTGTLVISGPTGAAAYVNGRLFGRGRVTVPGLDRFRSHNVRVMLPGHRPWIAEVSLGGEKRLEVKPSLIPR